jgi:hypothetical protein
MCSGSRWIISAIFVEWVHLFQEKVMANTNYRVFVLLNNHSSHSSPESTPVCCGRSSHLITLQLNIRHKTRQVDLCTFNQLKWLCSYVPNKWIATDAVRNVTQYQFCNLCGEAYQINSALRMQQRFWYHVAYDLSNRKFSETRISTLPFYRSVRLGGESWG